MDRYLLILLVLVLTVLVIVRWWSIWSVVGSVIIGWTLVHFTFAAFPAPGWDEDAEDWQTIGWPVMIIWCLLVYIFRYATIKRGRQSHA
jgi:hypothetical protein